MTFHFAHLAPPGAARSGVRLIARRTRCPQAHRRVLLRDRPTIPVPHEPVPFALPLPRSRAA